MSFLEPARLYFLLVVPVLVGLYVALQYRKSHYAVRFTTMAMLDTIAPRRVNWRQHVAVALALLTLAGGVVLFAKPSKDVRVPIDVDSPVTVVLTIDVSLSMQATDVTPDRVTAAKAAAKKFLATLPDNFQVALVSFAGEATVEVAPTTDQQALSSAIDGLQLAERTATGEGIYTALSVIKQARAAGGATAVSEAPAFIVLLSDGARTVGRDQADAAREAKADNVPIYTVALGTADGIIQAGGTVVRVPVEIDQLQEVADLSGGQAFVANTPDDLLSAYQAVSGDLVYSTERRDATSDYLPYLLLLLLASTVAGLFVASRWP